MAEFKESVNVETDKISYDELTKLGHLYMTRRCMEDLDIYLNDKYSGPELSLEDKERIADELNESIENTILYELCELIPAAIEKIKRLKKGGACNGE